MPGLRRHCTGPASGRRLSWIRRSFPVDARTGKGLLDTMGRQFQIPEFYGSSLISLVKAARRREDHYKKNLTPSVLDLGDLRFKIARHFGFCYGVENAIEITYRAVDENPGRRIFLVSEMIHNPHVNADLNRRGVRFIMRTNGDYMMPFEDLRDDDIVIIPAFGTTFELLKKLSSIGINPQTYNATCPFVEKVWKRAESLGEKGFAVIIHGKHSHEETRATFSHSRRSAPSLMIRDREEAELLARYIRGEMDYAQFTDDFPERASSDFEPAAHLRRFGVVNQTTMLASETQHITDILREAMRVRHGDDSTRENFANTKDTLCYATAENQEAMTALIESGGDLAVIVGGYNSSNTSHLVELCAGRLPAFYIQDAEEILNRQEIRHLDLVRKQVLITDGWLPDSLPIDVLITAGASCPDALVDSVISRIASLAGHSAEDLTAAAAPFAEAFSET